MRRVLWSALVVALSLTLLISGGSCTKTVYVTVTPAPTSALTPTPEPTTSVASGNVLVDASYSGKQVELSVGQSLVVTLESNATTGYSWALVQNSDDSVLSKTGNEYVAPQTTLVGAGGKEEWTFQALKEGTSTISMEYRRPWETGTSPATTFSLTVVVKECVNVDASYSGKQVELSVGQSLVVTLESNATTGYSWALVQNSDDSVLSKTGNEYVAPQTTLVGAGGKEEWTFKALKKGTSTISMGYSRPWESTPPVEAFDLTVVVK